MSADLHAQVDALFPGRRNLARPLLHALIDLGHVTEIRCMWDQCVLPGVPFTPANRSRKDSVSLDHIVALSNGGTDDWRNFQLLHYTCNMRKGAVYTDERRARVSAAGIERWADPEYRAKVMARAAFGGRTQEARDKRREAMIRHWADPERRAAHQSRLARGERHRIARPDTPCDSCDRVFKGLSGVKTHKIRTGCGDK